MAKIMFADVREPFAVFQRAQINNNAVIIQMPRFDNHFIEVCITRDKN